MMYGAPSRTMIQTIIPLTILNPVDPPVDNSAAVVDLVESLSICSPATTAIPNNSMTII